MLQLAVQPGLLWFDWITVQKGLNQSANWSFPVQAVEPVWLLKH